MKPMEKELTAVVNDWIKAYETRNKDLICQLFLDSEESFHYGTGKDEKIVGLTGMFKQLERDWSQSESAQLELIEFKYQAFAQTFAWIVCEMIPTIIIAKKAQTLPPLRSTIVVCKIDNRWKIVHTHASWPYSDQLEGQSFPQNI